MNNFKNALWGLVLVAIGVIWGLNSLEVTNIEIFFEGWWTLIIIVPCFINLFSEKENKMSNIIGLLIGILLLLSCQNIITFNLVWKLFFPVIIIAIGLSYIFKNTIQGSITKKIKKSNQGKIDSKEYMATFSGQKIDFAGEEFTSCDLSAIFGGIECNLTSSKISNDAVINISSIFGGVDIKVPDGVNVKVNSTSIFGGVDNKIKNNSANKVTLYVNATCLFGGVEIK